MLTEIWVQVVFAYRSVGGYCPSQRVTVKLQPGMNVNEKGAMEALAIKLQV